MLKMLRNPNQSGMKEVWVLNRIQGQTIGKDRRLEIVGVEVVRVGVVCASNVTGRYWMKL